MSGQPDHTAVVGTTFVGPIRTAPRYRFIAVRDEFPGLLPVDDGGVAIEGELYELPDEVLFESLLPQEPKELELTLIELEDSQIVNAMQLIPERVRVDDKVVDIADFGGWRAYQAHLKANSNLAATLGIRE